MIEGTNKSEPQMLCASNDEDVTDLAYLEMTGILPYKSSGGSKMPQEANRSARIEARIAPETLAAVKRAAELQGRSVSEFVVDAAREAAHRAIEAAQIIRLSVEDQRAFAEAIVDPPQPNEALRRAARLHTDNVEVR